MLVKRYVVIVGSDGLSGVCLYWQGGCLASQKYDGKAAFPAFSAQQADLLRNIASNNGFDCEIVTATK